jgi:hypothetical protein
MSNANRPPRSLSAAAALALAVALALAAPPSRAGAEGPFVVVCHASNPLAALSAHDLKKALTGGTKQWSNGAVVQVGMAASETPDLRFLAGAAGMAGSELLSRVQQQVFKGEMRRPVILRSPAECLGLAHTNPGAICVAPAGTALPADVKVLAIR